jgi:hypothetical protein
MATYTAAAAAATYPLYLPDCGQVAVAKGTYEIAAALSKDDIVRMCKVPGGCDVIGGWLRADDLDTDANEELDLDVGTAADPDALGNFGVLNGDAVTNVQPEAGINLSLFGLLKDGPYAVTSDTTFQVTVTAAAKGGGTGTLSLILLYTRTMTVGS